VVEIREQNLDAVFKCITAIQNNTVMSVSIPGHIYIPKDGSEIYTFMLHHYSSDGNMSNCVTAPRLILRERNIWQEFIWKKPGEYEIQYKVSSHAKEGQRSFLIECPGGPTLERVVEFHK
jgi:hypothetical protein